MDRTEVSGTSGVGSIPSGATCFLRIMTFTSNLASKTAHLITTESIISF